jgi:hypothetical protein
VIVPIYLFHRYEVDAVAKSVGGVDFAYAMRGDGLHEAKAVDGAQQRRALSALLATLDPALLDLPDRLINQLSQGLDGAPDRQYDTELFNPADTPVFDIDKAAGAAADVTLGDLLEPSRLQRVSDQGAREPGQLKLGELLDQTVEAVFPARPETGRRAALRRVVQARLVIHLARAGRDAHASSAVAAEISAALDRLAARLTALKSGDQADLAQARYLAEAIQNRSYDKLASLVGTDDRRGLAVPPGMPIGSEDGEMCWFCEPLGR